MLFEKQPPKTSRLIISSKQKKAVLITGVSSGIGLAVALCLQAAGYFVIGTVRRVQDGKVLTQRGGACVLMDVTNPKSIAKAAGSVRLLLGKIPLTGLVNNAGISVCLPWEEVNISDFRKQMEVNTIGVAAVTKAFLPLLKQSRGRIVMVSSTVVHWPAPFIGPYLCSKVALEAIGDSLRQELIPQGIKVISLQLGPVRTPIFAKNEKNVEHQGIQKQWVGPLKQYRKMIRFFLSDALAPEKVGEFIRKLLEVKRPPRKIIFGANRLFFAIVKLLPDRLKAWVTVRYFFKHQEKRP